MGKKHLDPNVIHLTTKVLRVLVMLVILATVFGCGRDSSTVPESEEDDETVIHPRAYIVTGTDSVVLIDISDTRYIFDLRRGVPDLDDGDYIVGTQKYGYLRKVHSADTAAGKLIVDTRWAHLTDVLIRGRADTTFSLGLGSPDASNTSDIAPPAPTLLHAARGVTLSGGRLHLSGVVLHYGQIEGTFMAITIQNGHIEFNPDCHVSLHTMNQEVQELEVVGEGTLILTCDANVEAAGAIDHSNEIVLASVSTTKIQMIGRLPIVQVIFLEFRAGFEFTGNFADSCTAGCEGVTEVTAGMQYSNGTWSSIASNVPAFVAHPFVCNEHADGKLTIYIKPRIDIALYSVPAMSIEFGPHLGFSAIVSTIPVWEWQLFGGVFARVGCTSDIISGELAAYSDMPIDYTTILDSGPYATDSYIYIFAWTEGNVPFEYPRGITSDSEGHIYIVDKLNHNVQKFRSDSTFVMSWGGRGSGDGRFGFPQDVAVDAQGNVYVIDGENFRVQKFAPDSTFITAWGSEGSGDGQFKDPVGIAVDDIGNVYVVDIWNSSVQKFTSDGTFLTDWGGYGNSDGELNGPIGIAVDREGNVYVSECHNHRVQRFTADGDFVTKWGAYGSGEGKFNCPIAVATDEAGYVYVLDYGNVCIQKFAPYGTFITTLGSYGTEGGQFDHPEGITVDTEGIIYVADTRNRRVQKFAPKGE
ncbi:MAG: hypothetical protein JSV33_09390 [bacterium]|nr:MAG: hypothetical protein JSV33_09390 [bacterium]